MHKSVLQELCQRNVWKLPEYSNLRNGPDHEPCFSAVVVVNGVSFQSANSCRTAKAAQNNAAEVAFNHLTGSSSVSNESSFAPNHLPSVLPTSQNGLEATLTIQSHTGNVIQPPPTPVGVKDNKNSDGHHWYKNRLHSYAQKRNIDSPVYSFECQGPQHLSQFKCKVTVGGQSYEDTNFFFTLKEAENAAAKNAFEQVSRNEDQEDKPTFYKTLLHELAQKRGFLLPSYETEGIGPPHIPVFVATVKVGDKVYQGLPAMTKKQAEMSAAKSAYDSLQDGTLHLTEQQQQNGCTKENLQMGPLHLNEQHQQNGCTKENLHTGPLHLNEEHQQKVCTKEILQLGTLHLNEQHQQNGFAKGNLQMATKAMKCETRLKNPCVVEESKEEAVLSYPTTKSTEDGFNQQTTVTDGNNVPPPRGEHITSDKCVYQKILVYPRSKVSGLLENEIASVMSFSDDKWVALKMNTNL